MTTLQTLLTDNARLLGQAVQVFGVIDDELYARSDADLAICGVGPHFRHCLDFYACLLRDIEDGRIDFNRRERDLRLETDRGYGIQRAREVMTELEQLGRTELQLGDALEVMSEDGPGEAACLGWMTSSLGRELNTLLSHTIHHFAIMAIFLRLARVELPEEFGVAPSTLRHWREQASCAP